MAERENRTKVRRGNTFAKRSLVSGRLSKKIGWLNAHGGLSKDIIFNEVKDPLMALGDDEAMRILKDFEQRASTIQNPTAYLLRAAQNRREGRRPPPPGSRSERDGRPRDREHADEAPRDDDEGLEAGDSFLPAGNNSTGEDAEMEQSGGTGEEDLQQQVEKQIQILNESGRLAQELKSEEIVDKLVSLGSRKALAALHQLEQYAEDVRDPTGYVITTIRKFRERGGGGQERRPLARRRTQGEASSPGTGVKRVLKSGLKVMSRNRSGRSEAAGDDLTSKVRQRMKWLNDRAGLNGTLDFDKVGNLLVNSGSRQDVMQILKTLEENASQVRDPNAYVAVAARRLAESAPASLTAAAAPASLKDMRSEPLDRQLEAHISWLNRQVLLKAQLNFQEVASSLLSLEPQAAGEILRHLEENASEVRDPTGYVLKAAQRELGSSRGREHREPQRDAPKERERTFTASVRGPARSAHTSSRSAQPAASANSAEADKLKRRLDWLNQHLPLPAPLEFERIGKDLLAVGYHFALEVLNNLEENASTVRDPNAYVVTGIRRLAIGKEGGSQESTSRRSIPQSGSMRAVQTPPPPPAASQRSNRDSDEGKLQKRIEWLDRNVCRNGPLEYARVSQALSRVSLPQAMEILKTFEEKAADIREPNAFVIANARRAADGGGGRSDGGRAGVSAAPAQDSRLPLSRARDAPVGSGATSEARRSDNRLSDDSPESRLRRRINWLNGKAGLQGNLDRDRVIPQLLKVGDREAMDILKRLEENAKTVRDPTGYVIGGIRRATDGGAGR